VFTKEVSSLPGIEGCAFSSVIPGQSNMFNRGGIYRYGEDSKNGKNYRVTETGPGFFNTYKIKFISGEGFTDNKAIDLQRVVVNAYAAQELGFKKPEDAVGQKIMMEGRPYLVSGVIIDFFQRSPKEAIEPQIFRAPLKFQGNFSINTGNQSPEKIITTIEGRFKSIFPQNPFNAFFLKDSYNLQFEQERRYSQVFTIFSLLVIFITILGLVGLAAYTAEQRKKEIGIRKTLGASESWLFFILFKDYILLSIIAASIALPIFHYQYGEWIAGFALQLKPEWWWYIVPVLLVLVIAIITVWLQSKRIIRLNPVENLKYE
jgi:putative ABC transport system permease protein